jgi:hypothetical protein
VRKSAWRTAGALLLLWLTSVAVGYWQDRVYWRCWWNLVTHTWSLTTWISGPWRL